MTTMTNCTFKGREDENTVKFTFDEVERSAECECGNKWIPSSVFDVKCKKCIVVAEEK